MHSLPDRRLFWPTTCCLAILALQGGASRSDEPAQLVVRVSAIVLFVLILWRPRLTQLRQRTPMLAFIAACACVPLIQLIPLPPDVWQSLPGREIYAAIATASGLEPQWRPISLTPDLTLDSLYAMLPPTAIFVAAASMSAEDRRRLALPCFVIAFASAVIGLVQLGGGLGSLYQTGNEEGYAIGLFANRNHNAALLACAIPLTAIAIPQILRITIEQPLARILSFSIIVFLIVMILLVGSRAGMIGGIIGTLFAILTHAGARSSRTRRSDRRHATGVRGGFVGLAMVATCGGAIWVAMSQSRAVAWQRLLGSNSDEEIRLSRIGPLWDAAVAFFPFGSGQGSFRTAFERFEPFDQLRLTYANQAHNEPLQIVIESGLPGVVLATIFLWWFTRHMWAAFRPAARGDGMATVRVGGAIVFIMVVAGLVDYPLRTPLFASIAAIACLWLSDVRTATRTPPGGNVVA